MPGLPASHRDRSLSVLVHFFEHGRWGSPVKTAVEGQSLTPEDQLFIRIRLTNRTYHFEAEFAEVGG